MGRDHRLLKRSDFTRIYGAGRKAHGHYLTIFAMSREDAAQDVPGPWRLGITATRKTGNAVRRNRQRRRIREFFRLHQSAVPPGWDFVVNTRRSLNEAGPRELNKDLERTLRRLGVDIPSDSEARPAN
jgi:ribonuclease P protein component